MNTHGITTKSQRTPAARPVWRRRFFATAIAAPLASGAAWRQFEDLGTLSGGLYSEAYGVSANGSVVVGAASDRAFRWTADGGMVSLGLLNGGIYSLAFGVNSNGSVVVGYASDGAAGNASRAFRWTETTGMTSLGVLTGSSSSYAYGVNADGTAWRRRGAPFAGRKPPTRKPPAW